jgi:adenine-specific DNA methylase
MPFADLKLDYRGHKLSLHDYFFAKSVDALKPGSVLALFTARFTLDKQNADIRERLAADADFLGAIRLPSDAVKREGTAVVADIVFLRKRAPGEPPRHVAGVRVGGELDSRGGHKYDDLLERYVG